LGTIGVQFTERDRLLIESRLLDERRRRGTRAAKVGVGLADRGERSPPGLTVG